METNSTKFQMTTFFLPIDDTRWSKKIMWMVSDVKMVKQSIKYDIIINISSDEDNFIYNKS